MAISRNAVQGKNSSGTYENDEFEHVIDG